MTGRYVRRIWRSDPTLYAPPRYRRACDYESFIPEPIAGRRIEIPAEIAGLVSDAEASIASLNTVARPALQPLARLLLRTESVASSKVEGMQVDVRSLARSESSLDTGRGAGPEALEVLANIDAMQFAIETTATEPAVTVAGIKSIHAALMARDLRTTSAGAIRDVQNWIGGNDYNPCGADYVPPPPEEVAPLLDDLCMFCDSESMPPVIQAAIAHAQFETIHPFEDGNGRTGRALIQVILKRRGLAPDYVPPVSVILARDRARYIAGLAGFRDGQELAWLEQFAIAAAQAATLARRYLGEVAALQDGWRARLTAAFSPRSDAAAWAIIDALPAWPMLTTSVAMAATGRTRPAVANGIEQLVRAGVLFPSGRRAWEADGLFDLITRMESGT